MSESPQRVSHSRSSSTGYQLSNNHLQQQQSRYPERVPNSSNNNGRDIDTGNTGGSEGLESRINETDRNRLNQLMQNFFTKMALVVVKSRMEVPPVFLRGTATRKLNKWFNVELEETDLFRDELRPWKSSDAVEPRPPSLVVETYLDAEDLTANQSLVLLDETGRRYNVEAMLNASRNWRRDQPTSSGRREIILERWRVDLSNPTGDFQPELAVVYKKSIVLFRSLYAYARLMPTWKFQKRLTKAKLNSNGLKIGCRIVNGTLHPVPSPDPLNIALVEHERETITNFQFGTVECPAGVFTIQVAYRKNCDFRVDDSESLLSSHFLNLDEHYFRPSHHQRTTSQPTNVVRLEPGSLPPGGLASAQRGDPTQAYGSLSSFHPSVGITSQSPITALRNLQLGGGSSNGSPGEPISLPNRSAQGSKASLRSLEGHSFASSVQRRPSVSFVQPFKSPSLSASPSTDPILPSSRLSLSRVPQIVGVPAQARQRNSLGTMSPSSLKSTVNADQIQTASSSQESVTARPNTNRYSSSFGQRRPRLSSGAGKQEDDNNSSGKGSFASSNAPGSTTADTGLAMGLVDEDKSLADFMDMIDDKKSLRSFDKVDQAGSRTITALDKFSKMKDSNAVLSNSLSSSLFLSQRAPINPSGTTRFLSGVPSNLSGASSSSSPGKPMSPHTPAVPSRLSLHETTEPDKPIRDLAFTKTLTQVPSQLSERLHSSHRIREPIATSTAATISPMNIPSSPHFPQVRRSTSVSQGPLQMEDSVPGEFETSQGYTPRHRQSTSLDSLERPPPFALSDEMNAPLPSVTSSTSTDPPVPSSMSPDIKMNISPADTRTTLRTSSNERVLSSSFGNRKPYKPTRQGTDTTTRPSVPRTPSEGRGVFPHDDDLLFDFSDRDMVQRRSLENERAGSGARRFLRGNESSSRTRPE